MRLDSEQQREMLTQLINSVQFTVTAESMSQTQAAVNDILGAIRDAQLEGPQLVPDEVADDSGE